MLAFYILKDGLDNFTINYNAFWATLPYIIISYLILSNVFELDKPKSFSFFGIGYTVTLAIVSLLLCTMAISFLAREFAFPRSIL
ncbi:MAG: sugar transferase, partial [Prevotella sp.]|nr:sugar transferase [Prevotella sp.]